MWDCDLHRHSGWLSPGLWRVGVGVFERSADVGLTGVADGGCGGGRVDRAGRLLER